MAATHPQLMHISLPSFDVCAVKAVLNQGYFTIGRPMTDIIAVCTHDAREMADEKLVRMLEAEQHRVRLLVGRQAIGFLQDAQDADEAVLLIWSPDARIQNYMIDWANGIAPERLIEISLAPDVPKTNRRAPVIDFSAWRGQRGNDRAWRALNDRLRAVSQALEPAKPTPWRSAAAMAAASAVVVSIAGVMRAHEAPVQATPDEPQQLLASIRMDDPSTGIGGVVIAIEPPSVEDYDPIAPLRIVRLQLMDHTQVELATIESLDLPDVRDPTFLERLRALNPLRSNDSQTS